MGESRSVRDVLEDAAQVVEQMLGRPADKDPISIARSGDNPGRANTKLAVKIRRVLYLRPMLECGRRRKWHLGKLFAPGKVPAERLEVAVGVHMYRVVRSLGQCLKQLFDVAHIVEH